MIRDILLVILLFAALLQSCGGSNSKKNYRSGVPKDQTSLTQENAFAETINPIINSSCGGASCHGNEAQVTSAYANNESRFVEDGGAVIKRLEDKSMPPKSSGRVLSDADRQKIYRFLSDKGVATPNLTPDTSKPTPAVTPTPGSTVNTPNPLQKSAECNDLDVSGVATKPDFANTIDPTLKNSCGGGGCHDDQQSNRLKFVGKEAEFKSAASGVLYHLKRNSMPIGGKSISAEEKQSIYAYLCKI